MKQLAQAKGISVNKLAEFDAHTRYKAMAATGNAEAGLEILAKLDTLTK